jgi:enoyl-CoA hydratase/carnithine racemase
METLKLTFEKDVAIVELSRPKAHAINHLLANELSQCFADLDAAEHVSAVILTGSGSIFSAGLDLKELYNYSEDELDRFWQAFGRMVVDLSRFSKPFVTAINGHAPAGGCVLALCADYRIMAQEGGRIGLNEVAVGVVLPSPVVELSRFTIGSEKTSHMVLNATLMDPEEAHAFGLVNELCPADLLVEVCLKRVNKWLAFDQTAWRHAKFATRVPLMERIQMPFTDGYGATVRHWWSPQTRQALGEQIAKLSAGKKQQA